MHYVYYDTSAYIHLTEEGSHDSPFTGFCGHKMPRGCRTTWVNYIDNVPVDRKLCPDCERIRKARGVDLSLWEKAKALFGG